MVYRNIYVRYNKMPYHLMKGLKTLYYYGNIYYSVSTPPKDYNNKLDLFFGCDCEYPKWKNVEKIIK
jgi:hypothetical protein